MSDRTEISGDYTIEIHIRIKKKKKKKNEREFSVVRTVKIFSRISN